MKGKRLILALLLLCLAAGLIAPAAFAAEGENPSVVVSGTWGDGITFALTSDGVFTVSGSGELRYDQLRVTYPSENAAIPPFETLVVSEGITRIGASSFATWGMKEAILYGDIGHDAFWECMQLETVYVMNAEIVSDQAFSGCGSLKNVCLSDSIKQLGASAFEFCGRLQSIRLPQKLMTLRVYTFRGCASLETVTMPAVQHVQADCFLNCTALKEIRYAGTEAQLKSMEYGPAGNVWFEEANFVLIPALPDPFYGFFDMPPADHWAYEGIRFCLDNGYMNGMGEGYFRPDATTTRAQLVTILWRMSGAPKPTQAAPFTDCNIDWAADAIAWAAENGIVNGVGGNRFDPDGAITREQLVTIFYRYCKDYLKIEMAPGASLQSFPDAAEVDGWARPAMEWAIAVKLISGVGTYRGPELQPKGSATRAQIARVILNFSRRDAEEYDLHWSLSREGTLTITGTGAIPDYLIQSDPLTIFDVAPTPWKDYQEEIRSVVIGEGITRVGNYAFCNLPNLRSVTLPSTLREIGDYAFYYAPLRVLQLPQGLQSIGASAFVRAEILELTIPGTVKSLGENAFCGCLYVQEIRVKAPLTSLPKEVFGDCHSLKTIYLPGTLKTVHEDVFHLTPNIEHLYFGGSQTQWDALYEQMPGFWAEQIHCNVSP